MIDLPRVTSSVYCSSSLIDIPLASVVTRIPGNFSSFLEITKLVVSPSIVELSARITSFTLLFSTLSIRLLISISVAETPSIGEITPPNTW